ncbi:NWD1 like protein, partial [Diaporthe sp. PMI_573]
VQYACQYWVHHWKESRRRIRDGDLVDGFLVNHLLHWLEALSVIGRIRESIGMVDNLLCLLHVCALPLRLSALLRDVRRVILSHCSVMDASPLQVYCSAIVFAPEGSVDSDWDACQQTLEGHSRSVISVAFADNDKTLASASQDGTIKLWDTMTGGCRATLNG